MLDRLAERCGILSGYADIWGREHRATPETTRALLAAMGVAAATDAEAAASLAALERDEWRRALPPVVVLHEPLVQPSVPLHLPARAIERPLPWRFRPEHGDEVRGSISADLRIEEIREVDGERLCRCSWKLPFSPAAGYHRLELGERGATTELIVAPARCYWPEGPGGPRRAWGPTVQLYALRSSRNWGIGDFTDLAALAALSAERGAGLVGVNPLHALFAENASPYAPSSRVFLDPRYLDVEAVPEYAECEEVRAEVARPAFQARLAELRQTRLVDHDAVQAQKRPILERLWRRFHEARFDGGTGRAAEFEDWRARGGPALAAWGVHETLREQLRRRDPSAWGWPVWPAAYRDSRSPEVAAFAAAHAPEIEFQQWLQWECERQLDEVGRRCSERSMALGLYQDLAVSVDGGGFDAWRDRELYALEARLGAPPDDFNVAGQDWGLPPFAPSRLRDVAYRPFVEALRANMRHAGVLRIDHVMILMRAFWVPRGATAREGAYVRYPFEDLLGLVALESQRQRCAVIGEDLGTVPPEVRAGLGARGVLSYRLFYFMHDEARRPLRPTAYPEQALVAVTTHDLPTLAGWWRGRDLDLRAGLGLFADDEARGIRAAERAVERERVLAALAAEGLLPHAPEGDRAPDDATLAAAVYAYLARTPARALGVQLEDALGEEQQANLPGTTTEHPNWRQKLPEDLETLAADPRLDAVFRAIRRERG